MVDEMIVLLHACTDRSEEIAVNIAREQRARNCCVGKKTESGWKCSTGKRCSNWRGLAATHLAIIDADEVLDGIWQRCVQQGDLRTFKQRWAASWSSPGYNLRDPFFGHYQKQRTGLHQYHSTSMGNRWFPFYPPSRMIRFFMVWMGDTHHRENRMGSRIDRSTRTRRRDALVGRVRRLIAKHRAYRNRTGLKFTSKPAAEIDQYHGRRTESPVTLRTVLRPLWTYSLVPASWLGPLCSPDGSGLDLDAEPWQERWCG